MGRKQPVAWLDHFPPLQKISDPAWLYAVANARVLDVAGDTVVFRDGEFCEDYFLVLRGSLRVQKVSRDGHEIILYHIHPGESCKLTTSCLLGGKSYLAEAVSETASQIVIISRKDFSAALEGSADFRKFVFSSIDQGMNSLVALVEEVAFEDMDKRLAHFLIEQGVNENPLKVTHQQLATELGTAREVISRLLEDFADHGWVRLHRGRIDLLDVRALHELQEQ